jgi:uncharacterized tellurite resistance protein B-like protein
MQGLANLNHAQRLHLMKFACAAVWADLEVSPSEKTFILGLALRLGLSEDEMAKVSSWLEEPPAPEEVDPALVPPEHRKVFLEAIQEAVEADHVVDGPERESLRLLQDLFS